MSLQGWSFRRYQGSADLVGRGGAGHRRRSSPLALLLGDRREPMQGRRLRRRARRGRCGRRAGRRRALRAGALDRRRRSTTCAATSSPVSENRTPEGRAGRSPGHWRDKASRCAAENARLRAAARHQDRSAAAAWWRPRPSPTRAGRSPTPAWPTPAREQGVTEGNPVLTEHGLVGRIVGVSDHVSRILLLTDVESRTPVLIDAHQRPGDPDRRRRRRAQARLPAHRIGP